MSPAGTRSEDRDLPPAPAGGSAAVPQADRRPDGIYRYLRELILDGSLEPGTVLSQVALARSLGVSRTPLREALRRLQQEGLVSAEHNQRARVTAFDADDLEFVYCNRILLEALAAAVTVPRLTAEDLSIIDAALDDMHASTGGGDEAGYEVAHRRLHGAFITHADDRLKQEIASFAARGDRYRRLYRFTVPGAPGHGAVEHQAIVDACHLRDQRRATIALVRHLSHTALALMAHAVPEREPVAVRTALLLATGQLAAG